MSESKKNYLNFTDETPNDQGSIIPNEALDFTRYMVNPVILLEHDWHSRAIGMMRDIHYDKEMKSWKGFPDFHELSDDSRLAKAMYDSGYLVSASIGGEMILKTKDTTNPFGDLTREPYVNEDGYMIAEKFIVFEISLPTLPSNYRALTDDALKKESEAIKMGVAEASRNLKMKIFQTEETENVFSQIVTLAKTIKEPSQAPVINKQTENEMTDEEKKAKKEADRIAAEEAKQAAEDAKKDKSNHVILESKLPAWVQRLIEKQGILGAAFGKLYDDPDDDDKPQTRKPTGKGDLTDQPKPTGLSAKEAKKKAEDARKKADAAEEKVKACKEAYEDAEEGEEKVRFKKELEEAEERAKKACKDAEDAEEEAKKAAKKEADEEADEEAKSKKEADEEAKKHEAEEEAKKHEADEEARKKAEADEEAGKKSKQSMSANPEKQTRTELEAKNTLAPDPDKTRKIIARDGVTFSALRKDLKDGQAILNRVFSGEKSNKEIGDYAIILNSIMNDPKYSAIAKQCRFFMSSNQDTYKEQRSAVNAQPTMKAGTSFADMAARLTSGHTVGLSAGQLVKKTTLTTDGEFASLDTTAVEWLTLILYKLFPSEDWKNEIPVLAADQTGRNLGVIWTNITAAPTIYRGTYPGGSDTDYIYSDTAVGMKLVPYWLEPMLWKPLSMHMLRYDQMATGWIQGLATLNAQIGDDLLYTLAYNTYLNKPTMLVYTGGWGTASASASQTFNIPNSGSKFIFNSSFAGDLVKPGYNDILAIEEAFQNQYYDLPNERPVLVVDSAMNRYIKSDPETKSLLTRWVNDEGAELVKISHTLLHERARVAAFDLPSVTVVDTHASAPVVPATTMSMGMAFIASQVAIGLGLIDVFMIQDPTYFGYRMSCDLRINISALRSDYTGCCMYTYGTGLSS